jgi:hypothetical protein
MPKKKIQGYDMENIPLLAIQYVQKKDAIKELDDQCKQIRVPLEDYLVEHGKIVEKGNRLLVMTHADVDVHMKHTLRVSASLVEDAKEVLKKHKLNSCLVKETIIRIDEAEIQRLHAAGEISDEVLGELYEAKSSTAFSISLKEKFHG